MRETFLDCLILLAWLGWGLTPGNAQQAVGSEPRIALIVDNDPDGDSTSDARIQDFRRFLTRANFSKISLLKVGRARMKDEVDAFTAKLPKGCMVLILLHGRVTQVDRTTVFLAADADVANYSDRTNGLDLAILEAELSMRGVTTKLLIVDGIASGAVVPQSGPTTLASLPLNEGTLAIVNVAQTLPFKRDDRGNGIVFLDTLLKQLDVPGIAAEQAFVRTRVAIARATSGRQVPLVASSLLEEFSLLPALVGGVTSQATASPRAASTAGDPPSAAVHPRPGETFRDCDECPELVVVPPGTFTMGSSDNDYEKAPHSVTIPKAFAIGRYEVTFAQWDACASAGACQSNIDDHGFGRDQRPVIDVSWDEVQAFLKWLSAKSGQAYRLPSEAEWEYAARAGSRTPFTWGPSVGTGKANCEDCSATTPHTTVPVGSYRPNAFGLFDTAGNAAEWVEDCWNTGYRNAPTDGKAWLSGQCGMRVLRGGSFGAKAGAVRVSARFRYDRDVRFYANGFRVARDIAGP